MVEDMVLWLATLSSLAWGGTFEVTLDAARDAMVAGDFELAAGLVRAAELHAPEAGMIIQADQLARIWLYRGMMAHSQSGHEDLAMEIWRQALAVDAELVWDETAYNDNAAHGLFEALRLEIRGRPQSDVGHPGPVGAARLFVDGNRISEGDSVIEGVHLAQIECPDEQGTHGELTDFKRAPKWLDLCPDGVDTSVVVDDTGDDGDEFADFGPTFGSGTPTLTAEATPLPPAPLQPDRGRVSTPLLIGAGGAALLSTTMYLAALNSRAQFDDLSNPDLQSPQNVADLKARTNNRVYLSAGTGALAVGLYTVAFVRF